MPWPPGACWSYGNFATAANRCLPVYGPVSPGSTLTGGPSQPAFVTVSIMLVTVLGAMSTLSVDGYGSLKPTIMNMRSAGVAHLCVIQSAFGNCSACGPDAQNTRPKRT